MANALKRRGSLTIWIDREMVWELKPTGKRGRLPGYSDAEVQARLTMKSEGRNRIDPKDRLSPELSDLRACLARRFAR